MTRTAHIYSSVPHETDGIYVEVTEPMSDRDKSPVVVESSWQPTVGECIAWSVEKGAIIWKEQ